MKNYTMPVFVVNPPLFLTVAEKWHPSEEPDNSDDTTVLPERPHTTVDTPGEPTHVHVKIEDTGMENEKKNHGSKMESVLSHLMLIGLVLVL